MADLENIEGNVKQADEAQAGSENGATPEESVEAFATDIADKATAVASGDMTPQEFVDAVTAGADKLSTEIGAPATIASPSDLGGLGGGNNAPLDLGQPQA